MMNIDQINDRLESLNQSKSIDKKRKKRISDIKLQLEKHNLQLRKIHTQLIKEKKILDDLEEGNLKALFTKILGNKEDQLELERQNYLRLVLTHNGLIEEINSLKTEKEILEKYLLDNHEEIDTEIKNLTKQKEQKLAQNPKTQKRIFSYDAQIQELKIKDKDFREVLEEANHLENKLQNIIANLKQVKKWGPYKMDGKGRNSNQQKKRFIDDAHKELIEGNVAINKFDKELRDLYPDLDVQFSLNHYQNFLHDFYENLITDWVVQRKLDVSIHSIENILKKLTRMCMTITQDHENCIQEKEEVVRVKHNFIWEA